MKPNFCNNARLLVLALLLQSSFLFADTDNLHYLNQLREQAGLNAWKSNQQLTYAAQNHAQYLHRYHLRGHGEQQGKPGYTGSNHVQRLMHAGYPSRHASENASIHTYAATIKESVDGLMAAIYHRFAFLSMKYDEIGIGVAQTSDYTSFVYEMGNSGKRVLCEAPDRRMTNRYYTGVCRDQRKTVDANSFDAVSRQTEAENPAIVVYPPANSASAMPAFYEEAPDPLPSYDVSGFPISVQFNPVHFPGASPVILDWQLYDIDTGQPLDIIAIFNKQTDPHRKLTAYQHVLFPLLRLRWNGQYRVALIYRYNGEERELGWSFKTRDLQLPIYEITTRDEIIVAKPGQPFVIYTPPNNQRGDNARYRTQFMEQESVDIRFIDDHTLHITPRNYRGVTQIIFHNRRIRIDVRP